MTKWRLSRALIWHRNILCVLVSRSSHPIWEAEWGARTVDPGGGNEKLAPCSCQPASRGRQVAQLQGFPWAPSPSRGYCWCSLLMILDTMPCKALWWRFSSDGSFEKERTGNGCKANASLYQAVAYFIFPRATILFSRWGNRGPQRDKMD